MDAPREELEKQVEAAYDYRGHVRVTLKSGKAAEGYLFNRRLGGPEGGFIELFRKDAEERLRFPLAEIAAVTLAGKDYAAGNSYEDYLRKKAQQQSSGGSPPAD